MLSKILSISLLMILFSGCGGGGGGGGEGSGGRVATGVRVLHGSIDTSAVDLFIPTQTEERLSTYRFAIDGAYARAKSGEQQILLTNANSPSEPIYSRSLTIGDKQHYSLLLINPVESGDRTVALIQDEFPEVPKGSAALRVVNGLYDASNITLTTDGLALSAAKGAASEYAIIPSGIISILVKRAADSQTIFSGEIELLSGSIYSVFAAGEVEYFTKTSLFSDY